MLGPWLATATGGCSSGSKLVPSPGRIPAVVFSPCTWMLCLFAAVH